MADCFLGNKVSLICEGSVDSHLAYYGHEINFKSLQEKPLKCLFEVAAADKP